MLVEDITTELELRILMLKEFAKIESNGKDKILESWSNARANELEAVLLWIKRRRRFYNGRED